MISRETIRKRIAALEAVLAPPAPRQRTHLHIVGETITASDRRIAARDAGLSGCARILFLHVVNRRVRHPEATQLEEVSKPI